MNALVTVKWKQPGMPSQVLVLDCPDLNAMPPSYLEGVLREHFGDQFEDWQAKDAHEVIGKGGVLHGVAVIRTHEGE